ncbi:MAG: DUF47 family protein [Methanolinea sp.]|nr:DUF47 family protein [Methanolinea sp.]
MGDGTFTIRKKKRGLFDHIFPVEYDFLAMLEVQAEKTVECVEVFVRWLSTPPRAEPLELHQRGIAMDAMRYEMEERLMESFSTPFDRQDIYSLSRQMDYIVNYSYETAREMVAFGVDPDEAILTMAGELLEGTRCMAKGVSALSDDRKSAEMAIRSARDTLHRIDDTYIEGMARLFQGGIPMEALKRREIYHHLRDAGRVLRATIDILHHDIIGMS